MCVWVLQTAAMYPDSVQQSLISACLSTLAAFLDWIPAVHIFSGELLGLILQFLDKNMFAIQTLECLTEVAGITMGIPPDDPSYNVYENSVVSLLTRSINQIKLTLQLELDFQQMYHNSTQPIFLKDYLQQLALFLLGLIQNHAGLIDGFCMKNIGT